MKENDPIARKIHEINHRGEIACDVSDASYQYRNSNVQIKFQRRINIQAFSNGSSMEIPWEKVSHSPFQYFSEPVYCLEGNINKREGILCQIIRR